MTVQKPEIHGPPAYYTQDWNEARASVQKLSALKPQLVITGHGVAMHGVEMQEALAKLAANFDQIALPEHGKYLDRPASIGSGREYDLGDTKRN